MIKINEAVIVEGKYDKIKLSNIIDAFIVETDGFGIYKNKEKLDFIRRLALERGIILLTDSDHSGFQIRNYISGAVPKDRIKHLYIPEIFGKEKRKKEPSKEGKLGVEGISDEVLAELFNSLGVACKKVYKEDPITNYDLYSAGISGVPNAAEKRKKLLRSLDLPEFLSTHSLLSYLNSVMDKSEFEDYMITI